MRDKWIGVMSWLLVPFIVVFGATIALAAAPVPPDHFWLTFDRAPQAVQLIECEALLCSKPRLLVESGVCRDEACLREPLIKSQQQFQCAEKICLYQEPPSNARSGELYLRMIAQYPDRARSSPPFMTDFRSSIAGYSERHLIVNARTESLIVKREQAMPPSRWQLFGRALLMTQASELLVAAAVLFGLKAPRALMSQTLVVIGLSHLLTFPVVWFFFPSLQPFEYVTTRVFGVGSLIVAIAFSFFLVTRQPITLKTLIRTLLVWILLIPVILSIAFVAAFFVGYSEALPSAIGIPSFIAFPVSEIFAIVWEAWLIYRISNNVVSIQQAALLSILMNAASLMLRFRFVSAIA